MGSSDKPVKVSFKEQMLRAREDAIVHTVNRLLAEKGFDAMTVDEVAAAVGIAKASLYKHFPSKEDLAAAAMVRVMRRAQEYLGQVPASLSPLDKLRTVARWTMEVQLAGEMPSDRSGPERRHAEPRLAAHCGAVHAVRPRLRPGAGVPESRWPAHRRTDRRAGAEHVF